jgi:hypothetical protein
MENINITTQGVKGGETKSQNVGYLLACLRHNSDRIIIDDYEGTGKNYKQRELQNIEIIQNGKILFSGDKYELFEILKNNQKN